MRISSSPPGGDVSNSDPANHKSPGPPPWVQLVAQFAGPVVNLTVFLVTEFFLRR